MSNGTVNGAGTASTSPPPVAVILTTPPPSFSLSSTQETQRENLYANLEAMYAVPSCVGISYTNVGTSITVPSTTCIQPGMIVTGTAIPPNTFVQSGSGTTYVLNNAPTASGTASFNGPFAYASGFADFALDPYMQTAAYPNAFGATGTLGISPGYLPACMPDGVHYSVLCNQEISSRAACAVKRAQGSLDPCWINMGPILSTTMSACATGCAAGYQNATKTINLYQLGPHEQVCGVKYSNDFNQNSGNALFSGGFTALTISVVDSSGFTYMSPQSMTATTNYITGPSGHVSNHAMIQATFAASGANISSATAGGYSLAICIQFVN